MFSVNYEQARDGLNRGDNTAIIGLFAGTDLQGPMSQDTLQGAVLFGAMISPHYERLLIDPDVVPLHPRWAEIVAIYRAVSNRAAQAATQITLHLKSTGFQKDAARLVGQAVYDTRLTDATVYWPHPLL